MFTTRIVSVLRAAIMASHNGGHVVSRAAIGKDSWSLSVNHVVRRAFVFFVVLAPLVAFAPSRVEAASILLPADTPTLAITSAADLGATNPGSFLAQSTSAFTIDGGANGITSGSLTSAVFLNQSGFVDIYYQITNSTPDTNNDHHISALTGFNFGGYTTSVGYYSDASVFGGLFASPTANVNPLSADRTADGNEVTLWFGPPWSNMVVPGTTSAILQIATNATSWVPGFATLQDHGVVTVNSFGVAPVPEPEIYATLGIGLVMLGWVGRRKKLQAA